MTMVTGASRKAGAKPNRQQRRQAARVAKKGRRGNGAAAPTNAALQEFRQSDGWEAGIDGNVALIEFGVGKGINTHTVRDPIVGFVFDNRGLMYDLSLEGSKFWKIQKG